MSMKVLLIGGTGCISSGISALAAQKDDIELYILTRGTSKLSKFIPSNAHCIQADIRQPDETLAKIKGMNFDVVADFLSYGVDQLDNTLDIFRGRAKQFIFISSATVYRQKSACEIITEDRTMAGNTLWEYSKNKILCERRLEEERRNNGLNFTIVRPAFTYNDLRILHPIGPGHQAYSWTIANRILQGKPLPMHDDGEALCTVTHVSDFAKAFIGLFGNSDAFGEAFHITSEEYLSWNRVAEKIGEALGKKTKLCHIPAHDLGFELEEFSRDFGEKLIYCSSSAIHDSRKVRTLVPEFTCTTNFDQGIRRCIKFYRDNPEFQVISPEWDKKMDELAEKYKHEKV